MTEPDLFVVCKNCSAEVSPYVTECPYCGQRVRKRAPKIEREGVADESHRRPARPRLPRLPRLGREEIPGIAPEVRPYATFTVVGAVLALAVVLGVSGVLVLDLGLIGNPGEDAWRYVATAFLHQNLGYLFIAMLATAIFGTHLERRFGPLVPVLGFVVCAAAASGAAVALADYPALGANGAALGLLCAWLVDDRLALRRGDNRGNDLIGVGVIAAALALVPLAEPEASFAAAAGGAIAGAVLGLLLRLTGR